MLSHENDASMASRQMSWLEDRILTETTLKHASLFSLEEIVIKHRVDCLGTSGTVKIQVSISVEMENGKPMEQPNKS